MKKTPKLKSIQIKFKKLHPKAVIPKYAKQGDAGLDLIATDSSFNNEYIEYKTGLSVEIPEGYVGFIFPRSSVSKYNLLLANSVGVIDSSYRGEICARFKRTAFDANQPYAINVEKIYEIGDRVVQLIIMPFPIVEVIEAQELSETERGQNGFGSTGN